MKENPAYNLLRDKVLALERQFARSSKAENELRRKEQELRLITDNLPGLVSYIDPSERYRFINLGGARWFGMSQEEIIGKPLKDILGETSYAMIKEYVAAALSGRHVRYESSLLPLKHGGPRWVIADCVPDIDETGKINGYFGLVFDITDRKNAEDLLKESEEHYRVLFEDSRDAIIITDGEGRIIDANKAAFNLLGYSKKEMFGQNMGTHYVDNSQLKALRQRMENYGFVKDFEVRLRKKDGTEIDCLSTANERRDAQGRLLRRQGIIRDITRQKKMVEQLNHQILRNQLILQNAIDGFLILNSEGHILEANSAAASILGYSPDEMRELTIADLEATSHSQEGAGGSPRDLCGGSDRLEMEFVCKDHRKITVEISISSVEQDGQELCFAFFHDITERKKTQQELLKRERKLKIQHRNLEEVNTALRVLLKKREEDKSNLEENVLSNIKGLVFPYLEKLKQARLDRNQMMYVSILESHLNDIVSPFAQKLSSQYFGFTPQEIRIASMVKEGLTNKEIAEILGTCVRTIAFHRENIRKKLGLKNKKANLETHLMSL